jgi:hypothetical protein
MLLKGIDFMIITNAINFMKNRRSILFKKKFVMGFCDFLVGSTLNLKKQECIKDEQRFFKT